MKLKKLEITGFKSFSDKIAIAFPPGISAVVGPNGCGKSNIIDALRWVMGEQSVKQLRGKSMEDVIFAGTNGKPPLNMAEVNLIIENDNGSAPEEYRDYSEIMLTRRLYRSGESVYFVNKQPCRLKDIHNVFLGSGIGARTYAIIQQGNIGAIIDAGPDERRLFLEEAAGVSRYKNRKNEALRKVASTQQNLLRISDIMAEVKRQMAGLKRQAKKAERFRKYQEKIKVYDVAIAIHHCDAYTGQIDKTDALLKSLKDADIEQSAKLKQLDAAVEAIALKRTRKDQEISEQKTRQFEIQRTIDRTENDLIHVRADVDRLAEETNRIDQARIDLEEKNKDIETEIHQIENENAEVNRQIEAVSLNLTQERKQSQGVNEKIAELNRTLESSKTALMNAVAMEAKYKNIHQNASSSRENLSRRLKRLDEEEVKAKRKVDELGKEVTAAEEALDSFKKEIETHNAQIGTIKDVLDGRSESLGKQVKLVQTLDLETKQHRSRYTTLKRMEETYEWYKDGVRAIMKLHEKNGVDGILRLVADTIEPDPDCAAAVEAVLGDALQYILVEDQAAGERSIQHLQTTGSGRGGFIPVASVKQHLPVLKETPYHSKRLINHISVKPGFETVTDTLLGNVLIAEDINEAVEIWNRNGATLTIVTKSGEVILPDGIMIGGIAGNGSGILTKKREVKNLKDEIALQEQKLKAARTDQESIEREVRDLESNLQKCLERKNMTAESEAEAEKTHYRLTEDLKYANRHLDVVRLESEQLLGEESDLDDQITEFSQAIVDAETEVQSSQERVTEETNQIEIVSKQQNAFSQRIVDLKLELTTLHAKLEHSTTNLRRLKSFEEDSVSRLQELNHEITQKKQKRIALKQKITESEKTLSAMYDDIKRLDQKLEDNRAVFQTFDDKLKENDDAINDISGKRETLLEKIRMLELEQSQNRLQRENITRQMEERYRLSLDALRSEFESPPEMPIEETESSLEKLKHRLSLMDDVNLGAIKEYETLKERHDFLAAQHDDLVAAIEDLHKVIRKINRITRERFLKTFHAVNEKLNDVFPRLFEGGTARLILTEPDNPLETGVEYLIHPPGKKLTRMSLLSGGEKALSAIAFIFSIFLIKPTAFCLLDEIDAPLDDVNVFRFNNLLQLIGEKSQIIMITHNKKTMEFADMLFGVTMEKKGISKIVSVNLN